MTGIVNLGHQLSSASPSYDVTRAVARRSMLYKFTFSVVIREPLVRARVVALLLSNVTV